MIIIGIIPILAGALAAGASALISGGINKIMGIGANKRQLEQQQALQDQQIDGAKEMSDYQQQKSIEMWRATNYTAQVSEMRKAGLNPALLYGGGGGGGTTANSGGTAMPSAPVAPSAVDQKRVGMDIASGVSQLMAQAMDTIKTVAQTKQIGAQTTNTEAQTANTEADTKLKEFTNAVNAATGVTTEAMKNMSEASLLETASRRQLDDYKAWAASSFEGHEPNDKNSPLAKAQSAGLQKALIELKNAKINNDIDGATAIIQNYKADLAKQGISPDSPWYAQIIGDLLSKVGITLGGIANGVNTLKKIF